MIQALLKLSRGENLSPEETTEAFQAIMTGTADPAQVGGFLVGLQVKGFTPDELWAAAAVMRKHAVLLDLGDASDVLDTCGTGGDHRGTFNISTAAALVAAACGVRVVKHGNRGATSKSGSADVLEQCGVKLGLSPAGLRRCLDEVGICFAYARSHHPAMKHVSPIRQTLGVATIFNVLGPLTNPAGARRQLMGVYRSDLTQLIAEVLQKLGSHRAWVVCADDGLDECSTLGPTRVSELGEDGEIRTWTLNPSSLGLQTGRLEELRVDTPAESARVVREVLEGKAGSARDIVLLNAAAAVMVAGGADDLEAALEIAAHAVDSGRAGETLEKLAACSTASE